MRDISFLVSCSSLHFNPLFLPHTFMMVISFYVNASTSDFPVLLFLLLKVKSADRRKSTNFPMQTS